MGRPRRYETDAEKQAAYRARRSGGAPSIPPPAPPENQELVPDTTGAVPGEGDPQESLTRTDAYDEDAYVQEALRQTLVTLKSIRAPEKTSKLAVQERLMRAEAYARWRWQAYHAGEVFSL